MPTYRFDPSSIAKMRTRLGIKQADLAAQLGVSKKVVSSWETAKSEPSLSELAAIYSIGVGQQRPPDFFVPTEQLTQQPQSKQEKQPLPAPMTAFGYWDMQNIAPGKRTAKRRGEFIRAEIKKLSLGATTHLNAYCSINQSKAAEQIEGWTIRKGDKNWDEDIKKQVLRNTRQNPETKMVFLVTVDKGYTGLIRGLKERGVTVHLVATSKVSKKLVSAVGGDHLITLPA